MYHYNTMSSLFIRADSIITIYDQRNVTPVRNAIRRETNQPDLPIECLNVNVLNKFRGKPVAVASQCQWPLPLPVTWTRSDEKLILLYCPGQGSNSRPPAHRSFKHGQGVLRPYPRGARMRGEELCSCALAMSVCRLWLRDLRYC